METQGASVVITHHVLAGKQPNMKNGSMKFCPFPRVPKVLSTGKSFVRFRI